MIFKDSLINKQQQQQQQKESFVNIHAHLLFESYASHIKWHSVTHYNWQKYFTRFSNKDI